MTMRMSVPIESRCDARTTGQAVQSWLRLLVIEMKRSPARLAALGILSITLWVMREALPVGVVRWREVSWSASDAMILASAITAGIAAFVAGRDRRAHIEEQLVQTVAGPQRRDLLALFSTLAWTSVGYLGGVAGVFVYAFI